jgi:hypothetical protein
LESGLGFEVFGKRLGGFAIDLKSVGLLDQVIDADVLIIGSFGLCVEQGGKEGQKDKKLFHETAW